MKRKIPKIGYRYNVADGDVNSLYITIKGINELNYEPEWVYKSKEHYLVANIHNRNRNDIGVSNIIKKVRSFYGDMRFEEEYIEIFFYGSYVGWSSTLYTTMDGLKLFYDESKKSSLYIMKKFCRVVEDNDIIDKHGHEVLC